MELKDKTALITGGGIRVGRAITLGLAEAGANVVINYYSSAEKAKATSMDAVAMGVEALPIRADIADPKQVEEMVKVAHQRFGSVDILINNASMFKKTPFPTKDLTSWHKTKAILIDGPFYCANAIAPMMLERGEGAIINIIDLSAWDPWPGFTAHSVGKAALLALTRQLALELAPAVRVNAIAPGPTLPPTSYDEAKIQRTADKTLLDRWGSPEDISQAVIFFIKSDYITGQVIAVDGGQRVARYKKEAG